jgi:B9 domain-containing protein 2
MHLHAPLFLHALPLATAVGYGVVRIPLSPGVHTLEVPTWRPLGNAGQEAAAWFLGGYPHLTDPSLLTEPQERHRIGTVSSALVEVECQVLVKGFEQHGVTLLDS